MKDAVHRFLASQPTHADAVIKTTALEWDQRFIRIAHEAAEFSKDDKTHRRTGAVLVSRDRRMTSLGYNGFPPGIADTVARIQDQELKRELMIHGEVNAVLNSGFNPHGGTLYCTRQPCHKCAGIILKKGVARVVAPFSNPGWEHDDWGWSVSLAREMFAERGLIYDNAPYYELGK